MTALTSVVTFKWAPIRGYRTTFGPADVNLLRAMVARHYPKPHRFICVTDDPAGLDARIEVLPLWSDYAALPSPHGGKNPSCYRRLRLFAADAVDLVGPRFVMLDLDCVVTGDLTSLFDRPVDFAMYGDTHPTTHYNGSLVLMTAGARRQVWETFDPHASPQAALRAKQYGSDQGWISYCLGPGEHKFGKADGVYSFRNDLRTNPHTLPANAKLVVFHGAIKPSSREAQDLDWVRRHYVLDREVAA